jgi:hypothetical protein
VPAVENLDRIRELVRAADEAAISERRGTAHDVVARVAADAHRLVDYSRSPAASRG